jgi:hypothetical protein
MTPTEVRSLSQPEIDAFYATLCATSLPVGRFTGEAWCLGKASKIATLLLANTVWDGKDFQGDAVINLFKPFRPAIQGHVTLQGADVVITYGFGLKDYLRPGGADWYLGRMPLHEGSHVVNFLLRQEMDV